MPWTTITVVFGSWIVLAGLTLGYFFLSRGRDWNDEGKNQ